MSKGKKNDKVEGGAKVLNQRQIYLLRNQNIVLGGNEVVDLERIHNELTFRAARVLSINQHFIIQQKMPPAASAKVIFLNELAEEITGKPLDLKAATRCALQSEIWVPFVVSQFKPQAATV